MNNHDIELPPLPEFDRLSSMHADDVANLLSSYGRKCARAAVEADRKRTADLLKNPIHVHVNMCRGIIAPITFDQLAHVLGDKATEAWLADRKHKGEVVVTKTPEGEIIAVTRQDDEGKILSVIAEADRKRRGEPYPSVLDLNDRVFDAAAKENDLVRLYIRETEEDECSLDANRALNDLYGASATLRELLIEHLNSDDAPQSAEPVKKKDWNVELSSWSDEDFVQVFHERPDLADRLRRVLAEPVKVPSDEEVLDIAIDSGLAFRDSAGEVLCAWREDADISEYLVENARALLERYSHLTATTHKSSNQNQLKG